MRILQLSDFYAPVIGGMEQHVATLSQALVQRGHHLSVATSAHPGSPRVEVCAGIPVYRIKGWLRGARWFADPERPFPPPVPDPGLCIALREILVRERPDVVHVHGWILYSLLASLPLHRPGVVVTLHDHGLRCATRTLMRYGVPCGGQVTGRCLACAGAHYGAARGAAVVTGLAVGASLHRRVDAFVSVSACVEDAARRAFGGACSMVVPTMLADELFSRAPGERPGFLPAEDGYLLYVGVLAAHKGLDVLLEAYGELRDPPPLVVLGTRYGSAALRYPERMTLQENVPHEQVMDAMRCAGVVVVPSCWPDPLPRVVIEAMMSSRAIVASRIGGIPDLVRHMESALLVPPGDRRALSGALQQMLDDGVLRAQLAENAFRRAGDYRASRVAATLERLYESVLDARRNPGGGT